MIKKISTFILSTIWLISYSQNDSLNNKLTEAYLNIDSGFTYSKNKIESLRIETYSLRDTYLMSRSELLLGLSYKRLGLLDSAALHFNNSEKFALDINDTVRIFSATTNLMILESFSMESPMKGLETSQQIYPDIYLALSNSDKALFDNALAGTYIKLHQFPEALEAINRGLKCAFIINDSIQLQNLNQKLGDVALLTGEYNSALKSVNTALEYGVNDCEGKMYSLLLKARILAKMKNLAELEKVVSKIHRDKSCSNFQDEMLDLNYQMYEIYNSINNSDSALKYAILYQTQFQETVDENTQNAVHHYRELYESERKQKEIEELTHEAEIAEQKKLIYQITAIFSLISGLIIILLLYLNSKKKQAQIESLEKEKEVSSLQTMLFAQEEERQRIARDLHDSIGALLSAAKLHISNIESEIKKLADLDFLKNTENIIDHASQEVRRVAHDMMPGVLMKLGLEEGLEDFFDKIRSTQNITVSFVYDELPKRLNNKQEIMIFRMIQELTNNTLKHANASEIKLMMKLNGQKLTINYKDDGKGFDPKLIEDETNFGLSGLKSRAKYIGATIDIESNPNQGVHLQIIIPKIKTV